jgi:hypothetical protein
MMGANTCPGCGATTREANFCLECLTTTGHAFLERPTSHDLTLGAILGIKQKLAELVVDDERGQR